MTVCKGEIWLADLNPRKRANEVGRVRPVLVFQGNALNRTAYPTVIVIPLTTQLIENAEPLRYRITARQRLENDSDLLVAHIRAIDKSRLIEKIAELTSPEMQKIKLFLDEILD